MRRYKEGRKSTKRSFKRGTRVNGKNTGPRPMRGGTRL